MNKEIRKHAGGCLPAENWYIEFWDAQKNEYWYEPVIGFGYSDYYEEEDLLFRHDMRAIGMSLDGESYVACPEPKNPECKRGSLQCLNVFKSFEHIEMYKFIRAAKAFED